MKNSKTFSGLTTAQKDIIAHWTSVRRNGALPLRSHINPGAMRAHLSSISMIEIDEDGSSRFRLVGSKLQSLFGNDLHGRGDAGDVSGHRPIWSIGLQGALEKGVPVGGILTRTNDRHAWLRLPLDSGLPGKSLVLCHDALLALNELDEDDPFDLFSATSGSLAA